MKHILLLVAIFTSYCSFAQIPASGLYGRDARLTIFRDEEHKIIYGSFTSCPSGVAPGQRCCTFNFKGTYKDTTDKKFSITTSWPSDTTVLHGTIICTSDSTFTLKVKGLPATSACSDIEKNGAKMVLLGRFPFIALVQVQYPHSYFYYKPDEATRMSAFFLSYDVLGVFERKNNWVKAAYIGYNNKRPLVNIGWMREQDLFLNAFR